MVSDDAPQRPLSFAFVTPCVGEDFFRPVQRGMRDAARMLGVDCTFEGTADVDIPAQIELVRRAIARRVDGLALSIIHETAFNEVVGEAVRAGIPVVAFNVDATRGRSGALSSICQDFERAGRILGERALPYLGRGARVLMTLHSEGISALDERLAAAQAVLRGKDITWLVAVTGIDPEGAAQVIGAALEADPRIAAVLCTGLADLMGASRVAAARAAHGGTPAELLVAGFDLAPEVLAGIKAGYVAYTIDQQPYIQGFYPVVQLAHYGRYGIRPFDIDTGAAVIDRQNVDLAMQASEAGYR